MTTSPLTRSTRLLTISLTVCLLVAGWGLSPAYGGIYYGHLHNHCEYSDGSGTPEKAYSTAKGNGLDFFGLADHAEQLTDTEYTAIQNAAETYLEEGTFTTFFGFEWSHSTYGHVAVIGSTELTSSNDSATNTFAELCTWLSGRTCIAFLNHPGRQDSTGTEFDHFEDDWVGNFVGMELWNKTDSFVRYYYNGGYDGSGATETARSGYFDEALQNGWRIGASGSQDHHGETWGADPYMMAVIANSNNRGDLLSAIRARHFYSTLDRNLELSFSVAGYSMGSSDVLASPSTEVAISAADGDGEAFDWIEIIHNGNVVYAATPANTTAPSVTYYLDTVAGDYIYCKVSQSDGDEAISSPVFLSGPDGAPKASLITPLDNGADDFDSDDDYVTVNTTQTTFQIQLTDADGIADSTVLASTVSISGLTLGTDYSFDYDWDNDIIALQPVGSGVFGNGTYAITVSGISDLTDPDPYTLEAKIFTVIVDTSIVAPVTLSFQQGVDSYYGTVDTMLCGVSPDTSFSDYDTITVDELDVSPYPAQVLIRFDDIIGTASNQIPQDASIQSATLRLRSLDTGDGGLLYPMLQYWPADSTWNTLVDGVQADNLEASSASDDGIIYNGSAADIDLDVTITVQEWVDGTLDNNGWAILPNSGGTDGWDIASAQYSTADYRPELIVTFITTGVYRPVADAGTDQTLADADGDGEELVILNGTGSHHPDPDKDIWSYTWVVDDDPTQTYVGVYQELVLAVGVHTITLTVEDYDGITDTDTVIITVNANQAPTADAGDDQTVADLDGDGYETIILDGSASTDPDGSIVSYAWTLGGQSVADPDGDGSVTVTLALGEYTAYLTVTDKAGAMDTDTITLTIEEPSLFADDFESGGFSAGGWTTTAQATVETGAAHDGTYGAALKKASYIQKTIDVTGISTATFSYWTKTEGLNKGSLYIEWSLDGSSWTVLQSRSGTTSWANAAHQINLPEGASTFTIRFRTDGSTGNDLAMVDTVVVTGTGGGSTNGAPTADAGADQTVSDSDGNGSESITLDASGSSDSDGTIASYVWTEDGSQIATGVSPTVNLETGTHTITLTVTDDDSATDTDTVVITVTTLTNQAPTADAGADQTVSDSDGNGSESITLNASGSSDSDGTIASYVWTEDGTQIATGVAPTVSLATGTHAITLTVTDNDGATHTDTVTITISAASASTVSVYDITVKPKVAGLNVFVQAVVTAHDQDGSPVAGAVVYANWYINGTLLGMSVSSGTTSDGTVTLEAPKQQANAEIEFTLEVTDIVSETHTFAPTSSDSETIVVTP